MKKISIGKKSVFVSDEDYELLTKYKWGLVGPSTHQYATTRNKLGKLIRMHRMIIGAKPGEIVDHVDRCTLNNQRNNLRIVSCSQNARNRAPHGESKFMGVCMCVRNKQHGVEIYWVAKISVDGKQKHIGCFENEIDAALAYDAAAKKFNISEYCNLNFG